MFAFAWSLQTSTFLKASLDMKSLKLPEGSSPVLEIFEGPNLLKGLTGLTVEVYICIFDGLDIKFLLILKLNINILVQK